MRTTLLPVFAVTVGILGASASQAAERAGDIVYAFGQASIHDPAGNSRPAARGQPILAGETVVTGNGRTQMRMADGGFIQIQPNTQFRIDEYRYAGREDGSERSFFNLLKGGIRFISGAIGHRNKDNFHIATTVATIGIRGSAGRADLCVGGSCGGSPDGLYVTGNQDTLTLRNGTGEVEITAGQTFHAACATCSIQQVENPPDAYAAVQSDAGDDEEKADEESEQTGEGGEDAASGDEGDEDVAATLEELSAGEFAAGDERESSGDLAAIDEPGSTSVVKVSKPIGVAYHKSPTAGVYSAGVAVWDDDGTSTNTYSVNPSTGLPVSGSGSGVRGSNPGGTFDFNTAAAAATERGSDSALGVAWARWSSNWSAHENGTTVPAIGDLHAMYATADMVVNVPTSGTVTYSNLVGGTAPTIVTSVGNASGTLDSLSLQVNFSTNQVTGSMSGSFPSLLTTFNAGISGAIDTGTLSLSGSCSGANACGGGVTLVGGAEFGLVGSHADAAVGVYDLKSTTSTDSIVGTFLVKP